MVRWRANQAKEWEKRSPKLRQALLDPDNTEIDDGGDIEVGWFASEEQYRARGWGEIHWDSYGDWLLNLEEGLNRTFTRGATPDRRLIAAHWRTVMNADRKGWDAADMPALSEAELEKSAQYHYPVYAVGYNWLRCNSEAAARLAQTNRHLDRGMEGQARLPMRQGDPDLPFHGRTGMSRLRQAASGQGAGHHPWRSARRGRAARLSAHGLRHRNKQCQQEDNDLKMNYSR
jgi:hypothetical protein